MSEDTRQHHQLSNNNATSTDGLSQYVLAISGLIAGMTLIILLYLDAIKPAVILWQSINAYNYCFLVIPIVIGLVWFRWERVRGLAPVPTFWGLGVVAAFGTLWCLSYLAGVVEGMQFAVIGLIQGLLLALYGTAIYRQLWLPFACLWLLVPSGQFLVPSLQAMTAHGAGALLSLTPLPIYLEHLMILAPHGSYMVAPGCSGLSFFLASLVVGIVFSELNYYRRTPKLLFVVGLLLLALVGNSIRVFLIILFAEWSGNVGDILEDHLFYGWGFFSLLLLGAILLGNRFRDQPPPRSVVVSPARPVSRSRFQSVAALTLVAIAVPSVVTFALPGSKAAPKVLSAPAVSCGSFALAPQDLDGGARATQVDGQNSISCVHADRRVRFSLAVLTRPVRQGKLLGLERRMIDPEKWSRLRVHQTSATIEGQAVPIQAEWIGFGDAHRLVWSLFWADGAWRKAGIDTLWADLRADLAGRRRAVLVEISSDDSSDEQKTAAILQKFLAGLPLQQLVASSFGSGEH